MGKFAIECPNCGSFNTASTGLFAKRKIQCGTCGKEIDTKTGRIISKICPKCETVFVFDQTKAKKCSCPTCGEMVDAARMANASYKYVPVNCPQCNCAIEVDKNREIGECPLCGQEIDIKAELLKQGLVKNTGISVIQYEGDNQTFIWKHPIEDFNYGSLLVVHPSQEAVFVMGGRALDSFGPGTHELKTENLPMVKRYFTGSVGTQSPFHAEVYFINKTVQMGFKWGTDKRVPFMDPKIGLQWSIGACGEFKLQVSDGRKLLIKLVGTMQGLKREAWEDATDASGERYEYLMDLFGADIQSCVKTYLAKTIIDKQIFLPEINAHIEEISEVICTHLNEYFNDYGLSVPRFLITRISLPEDDPSYKQWLERNQSTVLDRQFLDDEISNAEKRAKRDSASERERIANEAMEMRMKGYTQQDIINADIQKAYAAAMGQAAANGGAGGGGGGVASEMTNMMFGMKMAGTMMDQLNNNFGGTAPTTAAPAAPKADTWGCSCGQLGNTGKFCSACGQPKAEEWTCSCGQAGNKGKFCSNCGAAKPEEWTCVCGQVGNKSKFCSNCGAIKPSTWDCSCGQKNNTGKCCPECGKQRP